MAEDYKLPSVSEGVESVEIGSIHVSEGDKVEKGQLLLDVDTDKASISLESPMAGTITKLHVKSGDTVKIGEVLVTFGEGGGKAEKKEPAKAEKKEDKKEDKAEPKSEKKEEKKPPARNEEESESTLAKEPAPSGKTAKDELAEDEQTGTRSHTVDEPHESTRNENALATRKEEDDGSPPPPASPSIRREARKLGVDLKQVKGTGSHGRITIEDVQGFVRDKITRSTVSASSGTRGIISAPTLPDFSQFGPTEREPMKKLARTAAENLSMAWQVIPHVTQHDLVDITELEDARKRLSEKAKKNPNAPKITMTAIMIKAAAVMLQQFPKFNSSLDPQTSEIVYKNYYHIGVAVDTEFGLVVPVVRNADKKSIVEIAADVTEIAEKARGKKLQLSDMQGGTFTITNLGGIGGTAFTPIVNYPEVAILGMSRSQTQLVLQDGKVAERLMLPLSLSYDHRVINGADAARFMVKLNSLLSDVVQLLIEC